MVSKHTTDNIFFVPKECKEYIFLTRNVHVPGNQCFRFFYNCVKKKAEQITHVDRAFRKTFSVNPGIVSMTTNMLLLCWSK